GRLRVGRRVEARAPERAASRRDVPRRQPRGAREWQRRRRDRVRVAGCRPPHVRGHHGEGLPARAGRPADPGFHRDRAQSVGRHPLHVHRPAHTSGAGEVARVMTASARVGLSSRARAFAADARRGPLLSVAILVAFVVLAVFAPVLAPYDPVNTDLPSRMQPPGGAHILGTDTLGRDYWTRLIYGARISLVV